MWTYEEMYRLFQKPKKKNKSKNTDWEGFGQPE